MFQAQYRQVFKWPLLELCAFLNISDFLHPDKIDSVKLPGIGVFNNSMVKGQVLKAMETFDKDQLHPCPLSKDFFYRTNQSSLQKMEFETILPDGDYKFDHSYWTDDDAQVYRFVVYEKFKTMEDAFF